MQNIKSAGGGSWHAKPVAIPDKIGDPSLIKYVFLIIRENRTYGQSWAISPVAMATPRWRYSAQDHTERGQAREAIPSPRQFLRPQPPVG
ncbi:MAG: hypothetical protein DMG81_17495 [Acidobacteria bacterium]|nr:MAG: hypothetical protein DMG81_17495 [Acidobacteriota bacterium]